MPYAGQAQGQVGSTAGPAVDFVTRTRCCCAARRCKRMRAWDVAHFGGTLTEAEQEVLPERADAQGALEGAWG
jgi:hypothetical protein